MKLKRVEEITEQGGNFDKTIRKEIYEEEAPSKSNPVLFFIVALFMVAFAIWIGYAF